MRQPGSPSRRMSRLSSPLVAMQPRRCPTSSIVAVFAAAVLVAAQLVIFNNNNVGVSVVFDTGADNNISPTFSSRLFHRRHLLTSDNNNNNNDPPPPLVGTKAARFRHEVKTADGSFNGYPIYLRTRVDVETVSHCVGENYQGNVSWMHRSCEFRFFCFDTKTKEYVVFQSSEEEQIFRHVEDRLWPFLDVSQSYLRQAPNRTNTVSLGGINLKWSMDKTSGIPRLEWFPEIRTVRPGEAITYYELPPSVVMIPFHSMNGANPGHLVWDDFLPIYTLLTMYQLEEEDGGGAATDLLMMRYVLKDAARGLWASCDWNDEKRQACHKMQNKFLPLMMGTPPVHELTTTETFHFVVATTDTNGGETTTTAPSSLVCARHGVAGIGALTDHGTNKLHGWEEADYQTTHNHGRGGMMYEFRNFMLQNIGLPIELNHQPPFRVVFSENSSNIRRRNIDYTMQKQLLEQSFHPSYVSVESYVFADISLEEQLQIASQTSIFVTACGGGAVTSMFLPRGSSVIMYYLEDGSMANNVPTGKPARLDWDLFNNLAYLKVHWLPAGTMQSGADLQALLLLIQHELDGLIRERSYDHFFS